MVEIETGKCDICGSREVHLNRKYYYYDIPCECHSPTHFELIRYCKNCTPKPPREIKVVLKGEKYLKGER